MPTMPRTSKEYRDIAEKILNLEGRLGNKKTKNNKDTKVKSDDIKSSEKEEQ